MPELTVGWGQLIREGAERLRQSGVGEPRRQALRIWSELSPGRSATVLLEPDWPVDSGLSGRFEHAVGRRARGEPLAHVTGRAGFRSMSL